MADYPRSVSDERVVFKGNIFAIAQQDTEVAPGKVRVFERCYRTPGVRGIVLSEDKQKVLLTKEMNRYDQKISDIRLPGGKVFNKLEDFLNAKNNNLDVEKISHEAMKNELIEEAGIEVLKLKLLEKTLCNGGVELDLYYYIVEKYNVLPSQKLDEIERIVREWFTIDQAVDLCLSMDSTNRINEDRSRGVLLPFLLSLKK
ncbi:NUDIX hydrolase [Candidatus Microgenomates bacterium]|nr:NUDIX hydrolase [Candidatus Microgenomates bacterium]